MGVLNVIVRVLVAMLRSVTMEGKTVVPKYTEESGFS